MNGGMQRCFHILNQLANNFEVTTIIHQDKESFCKAVDNYPAINTLKIYSTKDEPATNDFFNLLPKKLQKGLRYRWLKKQAKNSADGSFLLYYPTLKRLLKHESFDIIILESLNTINAVSIIRKFDKKVRIIYDAHNVDSLLSKGTINQPSILKVESNLYKNVDALFTCSVKDSEAFIEMNKKLIPVAVIPNGVFVEDNLFNKEVESEQPKFIIFCGALWTQPNQEGLLWFYHNIWSKVKKTLPDLKLLIVGSGKAPHSFKNMLADNSLQFTGPVEDVKSWYNKASVAIVPLLSGSGTRLKILEAMSLGVPIVSTSKGAEGIEYSNGKDILIADSESEFATNLITLLQNKNDRIEIAKAARILVEAKYDWNIIGAKMNTFLCEL